MYETVRAHARIFAYARVRLSAHVHASDRRRLKRSPTSIALAINARLPQPRLFVYPCGTHDSALSTPTYAPSPSPLYHSRSLFLDPLFHYSTKSRGCCFFYFFGIGGVYFLLAASSDNSPGLYFRILPTTHPRFRISFATRLDTSHSSFAPCISY